MKANLFNSIQMTRPKRNVFDLTHDVKLSCSMGDLVPILVMDLVPGDKVTLGCEALVRFPPMVAPVMHRFNVTMHYFFVPDRLTWVHFEQWITSDPQAPPYPFPYIDFDDINTGIGTLADYMGIPPASLNDYVAPERVSAVPFAAYQLIWNEFYRDQNLITSIVPADTTILADGDNTGNTELFALRKRAWEHDYFTSCLPFAQKGTAVTLPGSTFNDVPVRIDDDDFVSGLLTGNTPAQNIPIAATTYDPVNPGPAEGDIFAQTSLLTANAATINDLRRAFRLQEYLEKNARGGTRYIEHILMHFGVKSSDKRLQRPEYITGTKSPIVISEVLNTAGTFDPTNPTDPSSPPQGNMAGHGIGVTAGKYGTYFAEEHGYVIGLMSIMPMTAYQQGIDRHWKKIANPTQRYYPAFAHIGEQEVLNHEIYAYQEAGTDPDQQDGTFGYLPRYAEYKFMSNRVAGAFRDSLDHWTATRIFDDPPALNQAFVEANPTTRIFAVMEDAQMYCHVLNKIKAVRPMPKFGSPGGV